MDDQFDTVDISFQAKFLKKMFEYHWYLLTSLIIHTSITINIHYSYFFRSNFFFSIFSIGFSPGTIYFIEKLHMLYRDH
jgi:hypothetical protein